MVRNRWWLILNGKSAGDDEVREGIAAVRAAGCEVQVRLTWEGGDARRYVDEAIAAAAMTP